MSRKKIGNEERNEGILRLAERKEFSDNDAEMRTSINRKNHTMYYIVEVSKKCMVLVFTM